MANELHVDIPKDINAIKTKLVFNLTKRQLICFAIALVIGLPVFFLTHSFVGTSNAVVLMMIVMFPCFLFAMFERYNQPFEKIIKQYINFTFIRPKTRPYINNNIYDALEKQNKLNKEVLKIAKATETTNTSNKVIKRKKEKN
ncbi:MAG: PrgI family protein [Clostridia bacterium]